MFSVLFEVQPRPDRWDAYLGYAKALRPELEKIDGFVDNTRYRRLPGRRRSIPDAAVAGSARLARSGVAYSPPEAVPASV